MIIQKIPLVTISVILLLILSFNTIFFQNWVIGLCIGVLYFILFGYIFGNLLYPSKSSLTKLVLGTFLFIALLILVSSIFYMLFNFAKPIPVFLLLLVPLPLLYYTPSLSFNAQHKNVQTQSFTSTILPALYFIGAGTLFYQLIIHGTTEATRSPWDILSPHYLLAFFLLTIFWIAILIHNKHSWIAILLGSTHTFLLLSVGVILFPIGFGYDPILHGAAENIIFETGSIVPKTILYIGEYVFVILLKYLTLLPLALINTFLLPILFSIFVPSIAIISLKEYFNTSITNVSIVIPFLLLIPLTQFTATTPQGLSYLFLIIISFWWLIHRRDKNNINLAIIIFLAITTLFIHPLTGIPLILWIGSIFIIDIVLKFWNIRLKQLILTGLLLLLSLVLPLVFLINNVTNNSLTSRLRIPSFEELGFTNLWHIESGLFTGQFNSFFDILYLYRFNWTLLFLFLFLAGISLMRKGRLNENKHLIIGFGITWLSSVWLTLFFSFSELISYEQGDFPFRLFLLSLYFVIPIILATLFYFWNIIKEKFYEKSVFIVIVALFITSVAFISYPRYDAYERVRSFTTSVHDIKAVRTIDAKANGKPYVVLANQSVSAAAVSEFGFKQYYNGHFFYPIPTGGPLYDTYLSMVYEQPLKSVAKQAANLSNVDTVFFVLNEYWFNAETIKEQALLTADAIYEIEDGKITIFTYYFEE